ncbi:hypothetical protein [Loigolactobacillus backii]|nr:hypothetical protein [Loigolactobacillus backii]
MKLFKSRNSKVETKGESTTEDKKKVTTDKVVEKNKKTSTKTPVISANFTEKNKNKNKGTSKLEIAKIDSDLPAQTKLKLICKQYNEVYGELQDTMFNKKDKLQAELARIQESDKAYTKRYNELKAKITAISGMDDSEFDAQMSKFESQLHSSNHSIQDHKKTVSDLKVQLNDIYDTLKNQQKSIEDLQDQEVEITNQMHAANDPQEIIELADKYRDKINDLHAQLKQSNSKRDVTQAKYKSIESKISAVNATISDLQVEADKLKKRQSDLNAQKTKNQQTRSMKKADLQKQIDELKNSQTQTRKDIFTLKEELNKSEANVLKWFGMPQRIKPLNFAKNEQVVLSLDSFLPSNVDFLIMLIKKLLDQGLKKVGLYTGYFDINISGEIDELAKQNNLDRKRIEIINPLYHVQHTGQSTSQPVTLPEENIKSSHWNKDRTLQTLTLGNDASKLQVRYTKGAKQRIVDISYFTGDSITKHSFYNEMGILAANAFYTKDGIIEREEYYRQNGLTTLVVNYETGKQTRLEVFDGSGILVNTFDSPLELSSWWLKYNFATANLLVIGIESQDMLKLIKESHINMIPFISADAIAADDFEEKLALLPGRRFIVDDFHTGATLVKRIHSDFSMMTIDEANLPIQIAVPNM